ncbi:hypothetical protein [Micrococcus luteus]|uniref:hypothetical protein n=1 Tax=Micrococcus luteus TaxID=1270 RepID=UPI002003DFAD|nr:hypothetical protein [Micrococcus luteus]MCK6057548.1 hypothetical protein [Micrococcus luteus]MCK6060530.1 hypothetical protein [Micrococcus luteus]MCK6064241.1 hypothetical protein [Micrococcus luteus]MCK6191742.1 hypothetical protein [Micrococcus luteus]MCK6193728.1 hypothetical protein [Micrococcus luteus]
MSDPWVAWHKHSHDVRETTVEHNDDEMLKHMNHEAKGRGPVQARELARPHVKAWLPTLTQREDRTPRQHLDGQPLGQCTVRGALKTLRHWSPRCCCRSAP